MHAHAQEIVHRFVEVNLTLMHAGRRQVLAAAVAAVMGGHFLSLTRLARGLIGAAGLKAALKRVDRLIGHPRIGEEARLVGACLMQRLSRMGGPLVIAVDWSAVSPGGTYVELRAAVTYPGMGRALTVYQQVYPQARLGNPKAERALLNTLHAWVGADTEVILVTDAGFRRPWFAQAERLGWAWIGRVRRGVCVAQGVAKVAGGTHWSWASVAHWFVRATGRARRFTDCRLSKRFAWACDAVLVRRRAVGSKHYRRPGHGSTPKASKEARQSAHEPWLLVHSANLRCYSPEQIVAWYARRMQIEETFRDSKSATCGMGQEIGRSRSSSRLQALLLIATLAAFLLWHIGQLAETEGVHRRFKATTRTARELSVITLAFLICALPHLPLTEFAIHTLYQRLGVRR
jgi:hypothetical protein